MANKRKWVSTVLILLGIGIASYPLISRAYADYWQDKLLQDFEADLSLEVEAPQLVESDYLALQVIYENEDNRAESGEPVSEYETDPEEPSAIVTTESSTTSKPSTSSQAGVIGKIKISKIDLVMPILLGASEKNLNRGAAVISGTSGFGEIGNVGVAAHRGRSYGLFFNRLDELENGDIIEVTANNKIYKYTVYKIHIVEPTDMSVLYRNKKDKVLTLVTCDPIVNPTHRLIVHAVQNP
ncbi:MAG TPA: class C sortase [Clostridiales bacterium UBA8960]|jgi:sortase A|nr:class C sortase [Clostridiales bacterium UBA8960]